jgi:hypothetical protein
MQTKLLGSCGFQCNRSVTDQIFCIHLILEKNISIIGQYNSHLWMLRRSITQSGEKYCTMLSLHLVYL